MGAGMAFREFTDSKGVVWRAWDVTTEQLHPVTRGEDYMGNLSDGWLAFESTGERRRMPAPYPADWTELSIPALEALCRSAPLVSSRSTKARTPSSEHRAFTAAAVDEAALAEAQRTFTSPRGRTWTVRLHECMRPDGEPQAVLRFTAGDIVVDLSQWPEQWREATVGEYGLMLLDADLPRQPGKGRSPQRRRDDRPADDAGSIARGEPGVERDAR
jgi:hypothetical protein